MGTVMNPASAGNAFAGRYANRSFVIRFCISILSVRRKKRMDSQHDLRRILSLMISLLAFEPQDYLVYSHGYGKEHQSGTNDKKRCGDIAGSDA